MIAWGWLILAFIIGTLFTSCVFIYAITKAHRRGDIIYKGEMTAIKIDDERVIL